MKSKQVLVLLAPGFEEADGVAVIHALRQAGLAVAAVGLTANPVRGAFGMVLSPDLPISNVDVVPVRAVVLPGGAPGARLLQAEPRVQDLLEGILDQGGCLVALGAACPLVLGAPTEEPAGPTGMPDEWMMVDRESVLGHGRGGPLVAARSLAERLAEAPKARYVHRIRELPTQS
jgi:4-methyl-5(b-hydroxyethyl)-thiazole monophosphate biosynthesis